ncbi:SDR family oxidoreductase [Schleiferiaceae bacterium]|nr:SDR family oxidoreductase [Schleiferiaceae bacterium]MDA8820478.1 SDR family oxidoreductase [Schleiferiaceae bacterium]
MKILYTGANGLLGQKISAATPQYSNHAFLATARGKNRTKNLGTASYASMDITDRQGIENVLSEFRPDVIIHGAAMTHVDECEQHKELAYNLNVVGTQNIVDAAKELGAHVVHISTDFIFDGQDGPYNEEGIPNPVSYYGETKLQAEHIVQTVDSWSILRTVLVIGIAEDLSRSNIVLWAKGALEKAQPIRVVDDQFRTPTLAEDLAQGALLAATQRAQGIFNISGPDFMSIYELVESVAEHFGLSMATVTRVDSSTLNQPAVRPPRTGFYISKAVENLGYRPHSFKEALEIIAQQAGL